MVNCDKHTFIRALRFRLYTTVTTVERGGMKTVYWEGAEPIAEQRNFGKAHTFKVAERLVSATA